MKFIKQNDSHFGISYKKGNYVICFDNFYKFWEINLIDVNKPYLYKRIDFTDTIIKAKKIVNHLLEAQQ